MNPFNETLTIRAIRTLDTGREGRSHLELWGFGNEKAICKGGIRGRGEKKNSLKKKKVSLKSVNPNDEGMEDWREPTRNLMNKSSKVGVMRDAS